MGRHADPTASRRPAPSVLLAAGLAAVLIAGGLVWWLTGSDETCETTQAVAVTVAPELGTVTERLLTDPIALDGRSCAQAVMSAQEPLQTVGDLGALEDGALPDIWVPDSSLWLARAAEAPLEEAGSMASSPVVLGTSRAVSDELGWSDAPPGWSQALTTGRPLAVPDLAASAEGLTANAGTADPALVAVYPAEGSPALDYPVLRVGEHSGAERRAVEAVVRRLTSDSARPALHDAGFRDKDGAAPPTAGPQTGTQAAAPQPVALDPAEVQGLFDRLSSLAAPSRLLAVFDVSKSMEEAVGDGTRATLARDAAKSALTLFPDSSAIGLWVFARQLNGPTDWMELVPTRPLRADSGGRTQREVLREELDSVPGRLAPSGTGLYDSTLAAVRAARADFDPTAVSSVVVITDGRDEDGDSIGLDALVAALQAEADPSRPVKVIAIGLGPDADLAALEQIGAATGGAAYSAVDENDLQTVLFDALRQRG